MNRDTRQQHFAVTKTADGRKLYLEKTNPLDFAKASYLFWTYDPEKALRFERAQANALVAELDASLNASVEALNA